MVDDFPLPEPGRPTPYRTFRPARALARFDALAASCAALRTPSLAVLAALSVKTNPRPELMTLARRTRAVRRGDLRGRAALGTTPWLRADRHDLQRSAAARPAGVRGDRLRRQRRSVSRASPIDARTDVRRSAAPFDARLALRRRVLRGRCASGSNRRNPGGWVDRRLFPRATRRFRSSDWRNVASDVVRRAAGLQAALRTSRSSRSMPAAAGRRPSSTGRSSPTCAG